MSKNTPEIRCPECGEMLRKEQVPAHLRMHWGDVCPDRGKYPEAAARYTLLSRMGRGEVS